MTPKLAVITHCTTGEGKYLMEWAAWLTLIGVGRIYVFEHNNESDELFTASRGKLTALGIAEFHEATRTNRTANIQMDDMLAAADACTAAGIEWLLPLDLDEFPIVTRHENLRHLVDSIPAGIGQIQLNWKLYGSNGETSYDPTRTHFEKFTRHGSLNHTAHRHGKSLLRVADLITMNLHLHDVSSVTLNGDFLKLQKSHPHGGKYPAYGVGWLAHFAVRSRAEFDEKSQRGYPDEWHGDAPGESYWMKRNLNDVESVDLGDLSALIDQRLEAWEGGSTDTSSATVSTEPGRPLLKVDRDLLPKPPQSVALWRIKAVLEIQGKLSEIASLIDALPASEPGAIAIRNAWEGNVMLERNDPGTLALGAMASLTDEELDGIFTSAERLSTTLV